LKEHRSALEEADAATIEGPVMELRQALEGDDVGEIRAKTEALQEASHKLARRCTHQRQQQTASTASAGGNGGGSDDESSKRVTTRSSMRSRRLRRRNDRTSLR